MAAARIVFATRTAPVSGHGPQFESRSELPKVKLKTGCFVMIFHFQFVLFQILNARRGVAVQKS